jgi:antitoxin YefM
VQASEELSRISNFSITYFPFHVDRILSLGDSVSMQTVSYTEARNGLAGLMESAVRDREPITITRNGSGTVVLIAAEEYAAMEETLHLLSTPANAECIRQGLADYAAGKLQDGELCD